MLENKKYSTWYAQRLTVINHSLSQLNQSPTF